MTLRRPLTLSVALGLIATLTLATAVMASSDNATRVYRVVMTGDQEATATCAPPDVCGDPDASGEAILIVNPNNDTVCFLARWRDIDGTVSAAHIHNGVAGVPAGVVVPLFTGPLAGTDKIRGCVPGNGWTDDINANPAGFYINIHSNVFPGGAIRAQLG
jgi:CHRD domain